MNKPSGWFQVVCIAAIVLGAIGILMGLFGMIGAVVGPAMQEMMKSQQSGMPVEQLDLQMEMQREIQTITTRWLPLTLPLLIVEMVVSVCLIVGAIRSLRLRPAGRTLLVIAFWAAVVVELVQLIPTIAVQRETMAVTSKYMSDIMKTSAPKGQQMPAGLDNTMKSVTNVVSIVAIMFAVLLTLAQVAFYVFGAVYMARPNVRALFAEPAVAQLAESG
ncbi:MAG: hypothetical protein JW719_12360 [Pirellulales bacterium]|nr:hypothetical protein [Pirellulales bacterium]